MVPSIVASSTEANSKILRHLAEVVKNLPSTSIPLASSLLNHCIQSSTFTSASSDDATQLVNSATTILSCTQPAVYTIALRLTTCIARSFPRAYYAQHWHVLTQRTMSSFKGDKYKSMNVALRAQLYATCAALVHSAAPVARLGGEHKARAVSMSQNLLRSAMDNLELSVSSGSKSLTLSILAAVWAVCATAPRELRAVLPQLDTVLRERLFIHSDRNVRKAAATLYAQVVTVVPEKTRTQVVGQRMIGMCADMEDILNILDSFAEKGPDHGLNSQGTSKMQPLHNEQLNSFDAADLSTRFSSVCEAAVTSLSVCLPALVAVPIPTMVRLLCSALAPRTVDPYAVKRPGGELDVDGALVAATNIAETGVAVLRNILQSVERDVMLPLNGTICDGMQGRLQWLVLQARNSTGFVSTVRMRISAYELIADAVLLLGGVIVDEVAMLLFRLLDKDVTMWVHVMETRSRDNVLFLSGGDSALEALPHGRKRRKHESHRDGNAGGSVSKEDAASTALKLQGILDEPSGNAMCEALDAGMRAAQGCFECRGLLKAQTCRYLRNVETLILRCIEKGVNTEAVVAAAAASAVSGGSNRMDAYLSPVFEPCVRSIADLCVSGRVPVDVRRSAVSGRAMCEAIVHPKGPPIRQTVVVPAATVKLVNVPAAGKNVVDAVVGLQNGHANQGGDGSDRVRVLSETKDPKTSQFVFNVKRNDGHSSVRSDGHSSVRSADKTNGNHARRTLSGDSGTGSAGTPVVGILSVDRQGFREGEDSGKYSAPRDILRQRREGDRAEGSDVLMRENDVSQQVAVVKEDGHGEGPASNASDKGVRNVGCNDGVTGNEDSNEDRDVPVTITENDEDNEIAESEFAAESGKAQDLSSHQLEPSYCIRQAVVKEKNSEEKQRVEKVHDNTEPKELTGTNPVTDNPAFVNEIPPAVNGTVLAGDILGPMVDETVPTAIESAANGISPVYNEAATLAEDTTLSVNVTETAVGESELVAGESKSVPSRYVSEATTGEANTKDVVGEEDNANENTSTVAKEAESHSEKMMEDTDKIGAENESNNQTDSIHDKNAAEGTNEFKVLDDEAMLRHNEMLPGNKSYDHRPVEDPNIDDDSVNFTFNAEDVEDDVGKGEHDNVDEIEVPEIENREHDNEKNVEIGGSTDRSAIEIETLIGTEIAADNADEIRGRIEDIEGDKNEIQSAMGLSDGTYAANNGEQDVDSDDTDVPVVVTSNNFNDSSANNVQHLDVSIKKEQCENEQLYDDNLDPNDVNRGIDADGDIEMGERTEDKISRDVPVDESEDVLNDQPHESEESGKCGKAIQNEHANANRTVSYQEKIGIINSVPNEEASKKSVEENITESDVNEKKTAEDQKITAGTIGSEQIPSSGNKQCVPVEEHSLENDTANEGDDHLIGSICFDDPDAHNNDEDKD